MSDFSVPQTSGGQTPKSNKIVLILVAVVVIAVLIYAFVGQSEDATPASTSPTTSSVPNSQPTASSTPTVSATTPPASSTTLTNAVEAYLRYLNTRTNYPDGKLLYLDNDEIPELYLIGACEADGSYLVTFANGKICEHSFGRIGGLTYVEKSGKYQYYDGHMGYYHLEQGTLSGGAFQIATNGISEELYNEATNQLYTEYTLNGSVVDSLAFEKQLSDWLRGGYILYGYENSVPRQTLVAQLSNLL